MVELLATEEDLYWSLQDVMYRSSLSEDQLHEYQIYLGEIIDHCPLCGEVDVEVESGEHPDMVGTTYWTSCSKCGGLLDSSNSACEYDYDGNLVDIH